MNYKPPYSLMDLQGEARERLHLEFTNKFPIFYDDEGYNLKVPENVLPLFLGRTPAMAMRTLRELYPKK